jgi:hypothetical protein
MVLKLLQYQTEMFFMLFFILSADLSLMNTMTNLSKYSIKTEGLSRRPEGGGRGGEREPNTTRNTVIGCTLSELVHLEPLLDHILVVVQDLNRY